MWRSLGGFDTDERVQPSPEKLRAAFDQDPNNLHALAAMARQLARVGQAEAAAGLLSEARERNPAAAAGIERVMESLSR